MSSYTPPYASLTFSIRILILFLSMPSCASPKLQAQLVGFSIDITESHLIQLGGTISSIITPLRAECVSWCGMKTNCSATIYDNKTGNCTVALTDYFQLVPNPNASSSSSVGMMVCMTCISTINIW